MKDSLLRIVLCLLIVGQPASFVSGYSSRQKAVPEAFFGVCTLGAPALNYSKILSRQPLAGQLYLRSKEILGVGTGAGGWFWAPSYTIRVLIVDDSAEEVQERRDMLERLYPKLSRVSLEILTATGGQEGWEIFQKSSHDKPIHVVFTDYSMPNGDGLEFARRIHHYRQSQALKYPFTVMVTGASHQELETLKQQPSINRLITKESLRAEDLFQCLSSYQTSLASNHGHWRSHWLIPTEEEKHAAKETLHKLASTDLFKQDLIEPFFTPIPFINKRAILRAIYFLYPHLAAALFVSIREHGDWALLLDEEGGNALPMDFISSLMERGLLWYQHWQRYRSLLRFNGMHFDAPYNLSGISGIMGYLPIRRVLEVMENLSDPALAVLIEGMVDFVVEDRGGRIESNVQVKEILKRFPSQRLTRLLNMITPAAREFLDRLGAITHPQPPPPLWASEPSPRVFGKSEGRLVLVPSGNLDRNTLLKISRDSIVAMDYLPFADASIGPFQGLLTYRQEGKGSHAQARARRWGIPHALWPGLDGTLKELEGQWVELEVNSAGVTIRQVKDTSSEFKPVDRNVWEKVQPGPVRLGEGPPLLTMRDALMADPAEVGYKTALLYQLSTHPLFASEPGIDIRFARGGSFPYRFFFNTVLRSSGLTRFKRLISQLDAGQAPVPVLQEIRKIIADQIKLNHSDIESFVNLSPWLTRALRDGLFIRGSTNTENLPDYPGFGSGMYETVQNVKGMRGFLDALTSVYAAVWSEKAFYERQRFGIKEVNVAPSIWLLPSEKTLYSAIIQTSDAAQNHTELDLIRIEIAQGLGEALVSSNELFSGFPTRLLIGKKDGESVRPRRSSKYFQSVLADAGGTLAVETVQENEFLHQRDAPKLSRVLAALANWAEEACGGRIQEMECALVRDAEKWSVVLLQTRSIHQENESPYLARKMA